MSNFPVSVDGFVKKLDKRDIPYTICDEEVVLYNGTGEKELDHDNVNQGTIEIWSGPSKCGTKINSYIINEALDSPWKTVITVMSPVFDRVFVTYESPGDQVEAADINNLQESVSATQSEFLKHVSDTILHTTGGFIDGGSFN